jgi:hypothetical protein
LEKAAQAAVKKLFDNLTDSSQQSAFSNQGSVKAKAGHSRERLPHEHGLG